MRLFGRDVLRDLSYLRGEAVCGDGTRPAAVELLNVSRTIEGRRILDGVNLAIRSGEFFALLGPSGCGKTTTLRLVAGFESPSAGNIQIGGQDMTGIPPYRRDVNLVFQNYALFPHLTVRQNIAFGLDMQRLLAPQLAARTAETLELVQLTGLADRYPHQLSGGEQQRVALARAIARRPSVLLLDEPLGALDRHLRKAMQAELKKLQRHLGVTFVYVTHDQEEALTMADRMAVMHLGRVLQVGAPAQVYERPTSRFVASFVGETNFLSGRVIEETPEMLAVQSPHGVLRVRADPDLDIHCGDAVSIAVRPEKLGLGRTPIPGRENCLSAIVEESLYLGADSRCLMRLNDGHVVAVRQANLESRQQFAPGDSVYVCFTSDGAHVLHDSDTV